MPRLLLSTLAIDDFESADGKSGKWRFIVDVGSSEAACVALSVRMQLSRRRLMQVEQSHPDQTRPIHVVCIDSVIGLIIGRS